MTTRKPLLQHSAFTADRRRSGRLPEYRISLTLGVGNIDALWVAAAAKASTMPGMTLEDVVDVLGPREDPEVAECLSMLTAPGALPGCALSDHRIDLVTAPARLPSTARRLSGRRTFAPPFGENAARTAPVGTLGIYDAGLSDAGRRVAPLPKFRLN